MDREQLTYRAKVWQFAWWIPEFDENVREQGVRRIAAGGAPSPSYYVLIVLSSLIASYGLLSNSTATVIGAMIVAPLMGPILGLALGIVRGNTRIFRLSLAAEISGAALVVLVGLLVAHGAGVAQIDFSASEIASRTRPTLFDLGIGLAAGFAGAFCMLHPGYQASVAGVAIAVALVPPLAVTGLTTAGWLQGQLPWRPVFGSFMLFLANYLTIEVAACLLFYFAGLQLPKRSRSLRSFKRAIATNLLLLLATSIFLSQQLRLLVRERVGLIAARDTLTAGLAEVPGADLDELDVKLQGTALAVTAVVGSRRDITPAKVASLQARLQESLRHRLSGVQVRLTVRTVGSVFASATGYLYEPEGKEPSPEQLELQAIETALRESLTGYSDVEMQSFRAVPEEEQSWQGYSASDHPFEVTLESPYDFSPSLVADLEQRVNQSLGASGSPPRTTLTLRVRTIRIALATSQKPIDLFSTPVAP